MIVGDNVLYMLAATALALSWSASFAFSHMPLQHEEVPQIPGGEINGFDYVQQVRIVGEDGRKTEEEYARYKNVPLYEIQNRFAATGILRCPNRIGSAQLTGDNRTLTSVAHLFRSRECKTINRPDECTFEYVTKGTKRSMRLSGEVEMGHYCESSWRAQDWSILKLAAPIEDVTPYMVPGEFDDPMPGTKVVSVSAGAVDFRRKDKITGTVVTPKSIEECTVKWLHPGPGGFNSIAFDTDCDSDHGNSGGSVLRVTKVGLMLVGVTAGARAEKNHSKSNEYREQEWATRHMSVYGKFLEAIGKSLEK